MRTATVLPFPTRARRAVKASLRASTRRDVQELIGLAPILGQQNPQRVPDVVRYVRLLIPTPPPQGGAQRDTPRQIIGRRTLAAAPTTVQQVFEWMHVSEPGRQAQLAPMIRGYLRSRHA